MSFSSGNSFFYCAFKRHLHSVFSALSFWNSHQSDRGVCLLFYDISLTIRQYLCSWLPPFQEQGRRSRLGTFPVSTGALTQFLLLLAPHLTLSLCWIWCPHIWSLSRSHIPEKNLPSPTGRREGGAVAWLLQEGEKTGGEGTLFTLNLPCFWSHASSQPLSSFISPGFPLQTLLLQLSLLCSSKLHKICGHLSFTSISSPVLFLLMGRFIHFLFHSHLMEVSGGQGGKFICSVCHI